MNHRCDCGQRRGGGGGGGKFSAPSTSSLSVKKIFLPGSLRNDDDYDGKKEIGLDKQNNNFCSLLSLHDYNVKMPDFTFCRGREQKTTTFFFFSWTLMQSCRIQLQKELANIWRISAIEFEAAQIHFLSDVFVAVAVVVA